jgi:ribonucleoside-diphosphate reductase alpha chain
MQLVAQKGSIKDVEEIPQDVRNVFATSHDIAPMWHIKIQAAFQKYTHNAVSKTVNFPQDATEDNVREVYMLAYKSGCKGVTIYRDKSRSEQVLNIEKEVKEEIKQHKIIPRPRPVVTNGTTTKINTGCGGLYVTINEDEQHLPFEVFMQMGKAGGCAMSQLEAIGRLLSLALRSGIDIKSIIQQLRGIRCPSPSWEKGGRIFSCSDAIARVIEQRLVKAKKEKAHQSKENMISPPDTSSAAPPTPTTKKRSGNIVGVCPDCGGALWHVEGCMVCNSCGYSKC